MRTIVFGPWVGEFSYEVQWWIPEIRQIASENEYHVVVVGYTGRDALYSDFIHEYISLPPEVTVHCTNPNCWAQRDESTKSLYLPNEAVQFYNEVCSRYENVVKHIPHSKLLDRRYQQNPYGLYKNLEHYDAIVQPLIDTILSKFVHEKTICIVPKLRKRDKVNPDYESWSVEIWESIVDVLINKLQMNVISFLFKTDGTNPGTHDLGHLESKYIEHFKQLNLNCKNSLDIQIGLLKNTYCSLYGSTGAAILPILCNTKMITFQMKEAGWRLNFEWQRRLTGGHKFIYIMDKYTASEFKQISLKEITNNINEYFSKLTNES